MIRWMATIKGSKSHERSAELAKEGRQQALLARWWRAEVLAVGFKSLVHDAKSNRRVKPPVE